MIEWIMVFLLLVAATFMLLASIGLLRLPDLPTRMHATTKSGVLSIILIMMAVGFYFAETAITARVMAIMVFTLLTAPVAAHAIGRAGYFSGVPLWKDTVKDELNDYYHGKLDKPNDQSPNP